MTSLEIKIERLTKEHEAKEAVKRRLPGINAMVFIDSNNQPAIVATCRNLQEAKTIFEAYPYSSTVRYIGVRDQVIRSPYIMKLQNPARPDEIYNYCLTVEWESLSKQVSVNIPIKYVKDLLKCGDRIVTDAELVFFPGCDPKEILSLRVVCYEFLQEQISFYAGYRTLIDVTETNRILQFITQ